MFGALFGGAAANAQSTAGQAPSPSVLPLVTVQGGRASDAEERREFSAAKIVVGRDEIERYGDRSLGDLLKRLPGVTAEGAPGAGGAVRMRGLGNGYTQILIDGERPSPGMSIESLSPDQVERIEIYRAPTAETGARAIAGTINILLRAVKRQRQNQLRVGTAVENGHVQPDVSWTRNDKLGEMAYNLSVSAQYAEREYDAKTHRVDIGVAPFSEEEAQHGNHRRSLVQMSGRMQWRGEGNASFTLTPSLSLSKTVNRQTSAFTRDGLAYANEDSRATGDNQHFRLNGQYNHALAGGQMEWRGGVGRAQWGQRLDNQVASAAATPPLNKSEAEDGYQNSASFSTKYTRGWSDDHLLVLGLEFEASRRRVEQDRFAIGHFDSRARSNRVAGYAQDEWAISPNWAVNGGLRWEGIVLRGDSSLVGVMENKSSVWSPLLHVVWKPDSKARDRVRLGLTRSYRSPQLQNLITQPRVVSTTSANSSTNPDAVGNPSLRPEIATGVDLAVERYLPSGGVVSLNFFHRRISDYVRRTDPTLETVDWSATPRWVSRSGNIGNASTRGIELDSKFRAPEVWQGAPNVNLSANASLFWSRVEGIRGPDNRLSQQPGYTLNLGADYALRSMPLKLGGSLNWIPAYATRLGETLVVEQGRQRVIEIYGLWSFNPSVQLRLTAYNFLPVDYETGSSYVSASGNETSRTTMSGKMNFQLRLEVKL